MMILYELTTLDPTDTVFTPMWRQGCFVMPFTSRVGVVGSVFGWSAGFVTSMAVSLWEHEAVFGAHISFAGLVLLASCWHWAYWDVDLFLLSRSGGGASSGAQPRTLLVDLNQLPRIHLFLASLACGAYGLAHVRGFWGPGMWTSDVFGVVGAIRSIRPAGLLVGSRFSYRTLPGHHILAGLAGLTVGLWHQSARPGPTLHGLSGQHNNIEGCLGSSITAVFTAALAQAALMWYGPGHTSIELFGPSRYHWDTAYFTLRIQRAAQEPAADVDPAPRSGHGFKGWLMVADKLVLYDYLGCAPSKGGLFRAGPAVKGDGCVQNYLGHVCFQQGLTSLAVRRMPAFFETFPVILIDQTGTVRADIAYRRGGSGYSIEQVGIELFFAGGILNATAYSTPSLVKGYARKAQFGELFTFDRRTRLTDGVLRSSSRGWFSFAHVPVALSLWLGHLWHGGRAQFKEKWTGL